MSNSVNQSIKEEMKKNMTRNVLTRNMKQTMKKQVGMTMISMIIVVVFLLFQVVIAMNVLPVYMTDQNLKTIMEELPDDPKAKGLSAKALKIMIMKRIRVNSIYSIKPDDVKIKKNRDVNIATIEYEPRGKLIGNLEYIVSFKHEAKVPKR